MTLWEEISGSTVKPSDSFLPDTTLLACVKSNTDELAHLFRDVKDSVRDVHIRGIPDRAVQAGTEKPVPYAEQTRDAPHYQQHQQLSDRW